MGRAGAGLHLPVLGRLRDSPVSRNLFSEHPVVACEPRPQVAAAPPGVVLTRSVGQAARLLDPELTVAHVCVPPVNRTQTLRALADRGFRKIIVEKPLATGADELEAIVRLRELFCLDIVVVAHWLTAELTRRFAAVVQDNTLGALRSISVAQHKPRFHRSLSAPGHPTAFDVEVPHSLGVALRLAGTAELLDASAQAMPCEDTLLPWLGSARLAIRHENGVHTDIVSDLTSPVRERRITLDFEHGVATGHFPLSEEDDHAQLSVITADHREHMVFRDDALSTFLLRSYAAFRRPGDVGDFDLHCEVTRLLCAAKDFCATKDHAARDLCVGTPRATVPEHVG